MKLNKLFSILLISIFIFSCSLVSSDEAENGIPFIAIDWIEEPEYYIDDNSSIPTPFEKGTYYDTIPQTVSFEYAYTDGFGWQGTYTIKKAESGRDGKFLWNDSKDGRDSYYKLILSYSGSNFRNTLKKSVSDGINSQKIRSGVYTITIESWRIKVDSTYHPKNNKINY